MKISLYYNCQKSKLFRLFILSLTFLGTIEFSQGQKDRLYITWTELDSGDFKFRANWEYNNTLTRNKEGDLVCDGFCSSEVDKMSSGGFIKKKYKKKYYTIVDTSHINHSCNLNSNFMLFTPCFMARAEKYKDTVNFFTYTNASLHSSIYLFIGKDSMRISASTFNITNEGDPNYVLTGGSILIDSNQFKKGILKGYMDIKFKETKFEAHKGVEFYWTGYFFTSIKYPLDPKDRKGLYE